MQSIKQAKPVCFSCKKAAGILTCRGCEKDFCYRHVAEHRQELGKEMEALTTDHDQLQQTITEQEAMPNSHPLMKKIDAWEQQSIEKIHEAAEKIRQDLLAILQAQRSDVSNDLLHLQQALNHARDEDDYVETNLKEWIEKLEKLKADLNAPQTVDFNQKYDGNTLVPKIFIPHASCDFFERTEGDVEIFEKGKVAVHGQTQQYGSARGRFEYSSGRHRFCFKIEQVSAEIFCGVVSKNTSLQSLSLSSITRALGYPSGIFGNGTGVNSNVMFCLTYNNQYHSKSMPNNIVELHFDCDQRQVCIRNNTTGANHVQNVNMALCPLPWQFFVGFANQGDRIRLCSNEQLKTSNGCVSLIDDLSNQNYARLRNELLQLQRICCQTISSISGNNSL